MELVRDKNTAFVWILAILLCHVVLINTEQEEAFIRRRRIINGRNAKTINYPWVVSLQGKRKGRIMSFLTGKASTSYCGGTIISSKWIVSAAHCFFTKDRRGRSKPMTKPKYWHVRMADEKLKPGKIEKYANMFNTFTNRVLGTKREQNYYHVTKIIIHPGYRDGILENDIALLKLKETVDFRKLGDAGPISVPWDMANREWPLPNDACVVVGWGCGRPGGAPQYRLQKAAMPVVSGQHCRQMYSSYINLTDAKEFCAGYDGRGVGICPGDSGGPIACLRGKNLYLAGVVSATHSKRPQNYPGLFTRLSYFLDWVKKYVR